jgi:hypothetical protein
MRGYRVALSLDSEEDAELTCSYEYPQEGMARKKTDWLQLLRSFQVDRRGSVITDGEIT